MWSKLLITLLLVHYLSATCDVCQSGKAACHTENTYSICIGGVPTRSDITCPVGYTCTGEKFICYLKADGYKPICESGSTPPTDSRKTTESKSTENTTTESTTTENTTTESTTTEITTTENATRESMTTEST
ncbi:uncharacterized protein LOC117787036, partial [Drosophila innubila]|uniref:uncharacterized protein LOC117787036 n=1 Tax=Drosophila innubila TaxID=198719 RepID=UPI00148CA471